MHTALYTSRCWQSWPIQNWGGSSRSAKMLMPKKNFKKYWCYLTFLFYISYPLHCIVLNVLCPAIWIKLFLIFGIALALVDNFLHCPPICKYSCWYFRKWLIYWPPLPRDVGAMRSWWWSCGGKRRHWCFGHSWTPACQPPHITRAVLV